MAKAGPAKLWAILQDEGSWIGQLRQDIAWLVHGDEANWPSPCEEAWPQWWKLLRDAPQRIKRRTNKQLAKDFIAYQEEMTSQLCLWTLFKTVANPSQTGPAAWPCRSCRKSFRSKAALGVHLFKVHGRCAEYRYFISGTVCLVCQKQFWTEGRLEDHARASSHCAKRWPTFGQKKSEAAPGYGSKKRRQKEIEGFTLAPPSQMTKQSIHVDAHEWTSWQQGFHRALCDFFFDADSPTEPRACYQALDKIRAEHHLYPAELQAVMQFLITEIEMLQSDEAIRPWTSQQYQAWIVAARTLLEDEVIYDDGQQVLKDMPTLATFKERMQDFDWGEAIRETAGDDVTRDKPLYSLDSCWEEAWRLYRDGLDSASVVRDPSLLLPKELQHVWLRLLSGNRPQVAAPASFWRHPLAIAFEPLKRAIASL
ncbi:unnamed protein product [Symbiodinium sp. CCMP2592]|nr:unnamed protein product [Symbiodinium sp. CCMP2592]